MEVTKTVSVGVYTKADAKVTIAPADTLQIDIVSSVMALYGDDIRECAERKLRENGIAACHLKVEDKGALTWVIDARLDAAIARLLEE